MQLFDSEGTGIIDAQVCERPPALQWHNIKQPSQDLWVALAALGFEPKEDEFKKIMQAAATSRPPSLSHSRTLYVCMCVCGFCLRFQDVA